MSVTDRAFNPSNNPKIDAIKAAALAFEQAILENTPGGRRTNVALTHVETASMYAVKAAAVGDA